MKSLAARKRIPAKWRRTKRRISHHLGLAAGQQRWPALKRNSAMTTPA
jgi:hypothetical protein